MDYQVVFNNNGVRTSAINAEFISNDNKTTWWWTNHILPIEQQDPWVRDHLFTNGNVAKLKVWRDQVCQIRFYGHGRKDLLENFLLFPYLYQSVKKAHKFFYPATVVLQKSWVPNGQHKLAVWDILGRSFDFPILWQAPIGTEIVNATRLTSSRQLADLIESRLDNVDSHTRIFFHMLNGEMLNLTTSVKWKTVWTEIKKQNRDWLAPVIYQIIMDNPRDPIEVILEKICNIPVDTESL
jgi:hypothetical protein